MCSRPRQSKRLKAEGCIDRDQLQQKREEGEDVSSIYRAKLTNNGQHFIALDFKEFIGLSELSNVWALPYFP